MKSVYIFLIVILSSTVSQGLHNGQVNSNRHISHHNSWEIPRSVTISLSNRYHHFDLIHTKRYKRKGRLAFSMIIQHGSSYARVTIGANGRYYGDTHYDRYPLENHYCDEYCSFQYQHYRNGNYVSYDPYYGCDVHLDLIVDRFPRYVYQPYYGYNFIHFHPKYGHYKRFRGNHHAYAGNYHLYRKPFRHGSSARRYSDRHGRGYGYNHRIHRHQNHSKENRNRRYGYDNRDDREYRRDEKPRYHQDEYREHQKSDKRKYKRHRDEDRASDYRYRRDRKRG